MLSRITFLLLTLWSGVSSAGLDDALHAVCRIKVPGSAGSGMAFAEDDGNVYVLTNAHVAGARRGNRVTCEFWRDGHKSVPLPGVNVWASYAPMEDGFHRDIAIVQVPKASFAGRLPSIMPLGDASDSPVAGQPVISCGCPLGTWPTMWRGHVLDRIRQRGEVVNFVPPPEPGRSGSAILDADGSKIIGLVAWGVRGNGIGMTIGEIRDAMAGKAPVEYSDPNRAWRLTAHVLPGPVNEVPLQGCPGGSCPTPGGNYGSTQRPPASGSGGFDPWPGLPGSSPPPAIAPPSTPTPTPPAIDLSPYAKRIELQELESRWSTAWNQHAHTLNQWREEQRRTVEETRKTIDERHTTALHHADTVGGTLGNRLEQIKTEAKSTAASVAADALAAASGWNPATIICGVLGLSGPVGFAAAWAIGAVYKRAVRKAASRLKRRVETRRSDGPASRVETICRAPQVVVNTPAPGVSSVSVPPPPPPNPPKTDRVVVVDAHAPEPIVEVRQQIVEVEKPSPRLRAMARAQEEILRRYPAQAGFFEHFNSLADQFEAADPAARKRD